MDRCPRLKAALTPLGLNVHQLRSAELLDQHDDDAVWAADVAIPVDVPVLRHLAHEFGVVGAQAVEGVVDGVDDEREARDTRVFIGALGADDVQSLEAEWRLMPARTNPHSQTKSGTR
jgi:hypothetical protein